MYRLLAWKKDPEPKRDKNTRAVHLTRDELEVLHGLIIDTLHLVTPEGKSRENYKKIIESLNGVLFKVRQASNEK